MRRGGRSVRRWAGRLGQGAAFVLAVLLLSELSLRLLARVREQRQPTMHSLGTSTTIMHRLWGQWLDPKQHHPFKPPFTVFGNRDPQDLERLRQVFEHSRFPASQSWTVPDFLQPPEKAESHLFTARTNSLRFRDPERSPRKPPRTYRIICLGAYQTFGLGVDDAFAYPRRLERMLNGSSPRGRRYEVWNGGRPSATAIEGLARLQFEVFRYEPDLVVLDYGFVDAVTLDDNLMPVSLRLPARGRFLRILRKGLDAVLGSPLAKSYLVNQALQKIMQSHREESVRQWKEVTRRMIKMVRDRGIPVILLDQGWVLAPESDYEALASQVPGVHYVSVRRLFERFPPSKEQRELFHRGYNWTQEFEPFSRELRADYAYQVDIFHPNAWGHERIAAALSEKVRGIQKGEAAASGR